MDEQRENASPPLSVFIAYAHEDEALRNELEKHLSLLRHNGIITMWHDRQIAPGADWLHELDNHLQAASLILLLISPDFLASDYCYGLEMQRALERHKAGVARVIPILLRPVDWSDAPFAHLRCLPPDDRPVTSWTNHDEAWLAVVKGIRAAIAELRRSSTPPVRRQHKATLPAQVKPGRLSRRKMLALVAGGIIVAGGSIGGIAWWKLTFHPYTYMAHHPVHAVAWSPDGALIVAAGEQGDVQVWNATDDSHIVPYNGHDPGKTVTAVAWSPLKNKHIVASASEDNTIHVWDAPSGEMDSTFSHPTKVYDVAWSPDGKFIVSGSDDGKVRVWDVTNHEQPLHVYIGHTQAVASIDWSPNGKYIASGSDDHTVRVWDVAHPARPLFTYPRHNNNVNAVAWSLDSQRIASASNDSTVQVWNALDGGNRFLYDQHSGPVNAIAWSPDGKSIASASDDKTVQIWDADTLEPLRSYHGHTDAVNAVTWSPDGTHIASGSADQTVQVWATSMGILFF